MAISDLPPAPPAVVIEEAEDSAPETPTGKFTPADLIPRILPASQVHLFSGASGAGKTALTFSLLASMHTGTAFFDLGIVRKPNFIGYLAADRTWDDHKIWLETVGLSSLPYYSLIDDLTMSGSQIRSKKHGDRFELFRRCIAGMLIREGLAPAVSLSGNIGEVTRAVSSTLKHLPKDSFIVVDPISLFLGGDLLRYDVVYSHMLDLNQFCLRHSCTLLGVAHAGKQKGDSGQRYARAQDRIVGTTAQTGCAGTVMHLSPPTELEKNATWSELTLVPHHAAARDLKMIRDETNGLFIPLSPEQAVQASKAATATTDKEAAALLNAKEASADLLAFFPKDSSEITTKELVALAEKPTTEGGLDIKRTMTYRHLGCLEALGLVSKGTKPGTWKRTGKN